MRAGSLLRGFRVIFHYVWTQLDIFRTKAPGLLSLELIMKLLGRSSADGKPFRSDDKYCHWVWHAANECYCLMPANILR